MNGGWHVGSAECMECMDNEETVQVQVPWLLTEGARLPFTSAGGVPRMGMQIAVSNFSVILCLLRPSVLPSLNYAEGKARGGYDLSSDSKSPEHRHHSKLIPCKLILFNYRKLHTSPC